jgi:cell division septal protein FtsQ
MTQAADEPKQPPEPLGDDLPEAPPAITTVDLPPVVLNLAAARAEAEQQANKTTADKADASALGLGAPELPQPAVLEEEESDEDIEPEHDLSVPGDHKLPPLPSPRKKTRRHLVQARRRQKTFLEKRRDQKRRRYMYNRVRMIIRLVCTVLIGFALWRFATAQLLIYKEPRFELIQNHLLTAKDLTPFLAPYAGQPLYTIDPEQLAASMKERFILIDRVYVRRYLFPARLQINLMEKMPWAEVYESPDAPRPYAVLTQGADEKYTLIDLKDYHYNPDPVRPLPKVVVPQMVGLRPRFIAKLDTLLHQLQSVRGMHFQYLDSSVPDQLLARFDVVDVHIGRLEPATTARLERLIPLIPKIHEMKDQITSVDLRWSNQITFHKKKSGSAKTADSPEPTVGTPQAVEGTPQQPATTAPREDH